LSARRVPSLLPAAENVELVRAGLPAGHRGVDGGFSEWAAVPQEFVDEGDFVVVRVQQVVRGEASGVSVEGAFWFVFEVHDARVTRLSFYVRETEALEAAGLRG
jgi:hypothetical protein